MSAEDIARLERRIAALEDERAIARVIASYGPLVDAGEAEAAARLWTENGIYDVDQWLIDGRAAIADMVRSEAHQGLIARGCCHFFGPPLITVGGDEATAICQSVLLLHSEGRGFRAVRAGLHVLALRRIDGSWKITRRTARQLDGGASARALLNTAITAQHPDDF